MDREALPLPNVRLPEVTLARAQALVPAAQADPRFGGQGRVTRAHVLREAVRLGLDMLEARYADATAASPAE